MRANAEYREGDSLRAKFFRWKDRMMEKVVLPDDWNDVAKAALPADVNAPVSAA